MIYLLQGLVYLFSFVLATVLMGTAVAPALLFWLWVAERISLWDAWVRIWVLGLTCGPAFLIYILALIVLTALLIRALPRVREGSYPFVSLGTLTWYLHAALMFPMMKTVLPVIALSGLNILYFRLLGAKIGKGVQLNAPLGDPALTEIGDGTVIGGDAIIICHAAEREYLKLKRVKIGARVTIGTRAIIFPGVEIGDRAVIGAGAVVLKDKKIPPGTLWAGVPARPVTQEKQHEDQNSL